jgi:hypothetical protein
MPGRSVFAFTKIKAGVRINGMVYGGTEELLDLRDLRKVK